MSNSSIRKNISNKLLQEFTTQREKTIGEAAGTLLQSSKVQQCLVLKTKETNAIQKGFEAAIGRQLTTSEGTKYRRELKKEIRKLSVPFPDSGSLQDVFFKKLVKDQRLVFGRSIFYLPYSFDTIKTKIGDFNKSFLVNNLKGREDSYNSKEFGRTTHLDHGADGAASGIVGAVAGAFSLIGSVEQYTKNKNIFEQNLIYEVDSGLNFLTKGQRGKLKDLVWNLVVLSEQILTKGGDLKAGISMLLTPISAELNLKRGSKEERLLQEAFISSFEKTFANVDYLNLEGSSTLKEKIAKTLVLDNIVKPLKNNKNVKAKTTIKNVNTRTKSRSKDTTKSSKSSKVKTINRGGARAALATKGRTSPISISNQLAMLGIFNRDLPSVLQKNMSSPALNYQTGRFASSVRVLDVNITSKGYPSFGYTYDKYPYQTFEPGYAQGSPDRDPRRLIDRSMREIAASQGMGRFFTRRL